MTRTKRRRSRRYHSIYQIAEVLAIIAGIAGIIIAVIGLLSDALGSSWIWDGNFGFLTGVLNTILAIVFSALVLLIGLGTIFWDIRGLVIGIVVIILSLFIPGIAFILGIVSGVLFIVADIA